MCGHDRLRPLDLAHFEVDAVLQVGVLAEVELVPLGVVETGAHGAWVLVGRRTRLGTELGRVQGLRLH